MTSKDQLYSTGNSSSPYSVMTYMEKNLKMSEKKEWMYINN